MSNDRMSVRSQRPLPTCLTPRHEQTGKWSDKEMCMILHKSLVYPFPLAANLYNERLEHPKYNVTINLLIFYLSLIYSEKFFYVKYV